MRFNIDWASLIVGRKFTVFALFYFVFEGNFQVQAPRGAYIWRGDLTERFLRYRIGWLIFGGSYFRNFTVFTEHDVTSLTYIDRVASTAMMMTKIAKTTTMVIKRSQGRKWLYKNKRLEGEYKNTLLV